MDVDGRIREELVVGVPRPQERARVGVRDGGALAHDVAQLARGDESPLAVALWSAVGWKSGSFLLRCLQTASSYLHSPTPTAPNRMHASTQPSPPSLTCSTLAAST